MAGGGKGNERFAEKTRRNGELTRGRKLRQAHRAGVRLMVVRNLANAVTLVKSNSSKWIREQGKNFAWQEGYGAFSVSSSNVASVIKYIDTQEAHHRKISFEDEFISLLKKHGMSFDPKYVFG